MDDGITFVPEHPDMRLLCSDGQAVPAHSYLLAYASAPLRPAIILALQAVAPAMCLTACSCASPAPAGQLADPDATRRRSQ